ncbi:MAG TPA: aldo/keto reductase [Gammaproteobacteria bacterium]|nr:aldo/keto reductase [Gammaproteobacteria bacterium]
MTVIPKVEMSPLGPLFSSLVQGYWRLDHWKLSTQQCLSFIKEHVALGITSVDHAHVYGNPSCEQLFGDALKLQPALRHEIEIISKCDICLAESNRVAHYDTGKPAIMASVESSLKRLGTDYLDVLLLHRPDYLMDADEVAEAFNYLKTRGMVKYFGVSNFTSAQLALLQSRLDSTLVTNQIEMNPVNLEVLDSGVLENMQTFRMRPMAWSCLAGGRIFSEHGERFERLRHTLHNVATEIGAQTIDQVIYAWVMHMPSKPVPVLGTGNMARVRAAVDSLAFTLTREQWYRIWTASKGHNVP